VLGIRLYLIESMTHECEVSYCTRLTPGSQYARCSAHESVPTRTGWPPVGRRARELDRMKKAACFCFYCKIAVVDDPHLSQSKTWDHLIPQAKGGSHGDDNLVVACNRCNMSKGKMTASEFVKSLEEKKAGRKRYV